MKTCPECLTKTLQNITTSTEITQDDMTYVIENIPTIQCTNCNETFYGSESNKYIDNQLEIFKSEGFVNNIDIIRKQKGLTQEQLGQLLGGLTKQRIGQLEKDNNLDVRTMYKLANALNEPIPVIFQFKRIVQKNNKFYLEN